MTESKSLVVVAGIARSSYDELAPVLDRHKLSVVQVASAEEVIKLASSKRVELVILGAGPTDMSLDEVVQTIRSESSPSRTASLLVLAAPDTADQARRLIGRGVNRVMLTVDPPRLLALHAADLLDIAPRATLRLTTRMLVEVNDGFKEALGAYRAALEPVAAKVEVIRRADPEREGIAGIGARFLTFAGDSQKRLDAILSEAFHIPIEQLRSSR